ncbi:MAG: Hsp70 family protein [Pirellulales bacterium]
MTARYVVGIDLGTTNSVVAYAPLDSDQLNVSLLEIPQLVAAGTWESRSSLPSFLYLASPSEVAGGACRTPWDTDLTYAVGQFAQRQSAEVPQRTVAGAKSWLCHNRVDRHQPILPWGAPDDVPRVSPVTAARRYLEHLVQAWNARFPESPLHQQQVVLTVPASFDAAARELTREAAAAAGLPESLVLLEEPQAAVYAWLAVMGDRWRRIVKVDETLLVCDIGGGTTDLTLVRATEDQGQLSLQRVAVGNHLLVGGDNMDLALAHLVASQLATQGTQLDPWQSVGLWHSCRAAKETLLGQDGPDSYPVAVLGRGSRLIGGTIKTELQRQQVFDLLRDGFFPVCEPQAMPARQRASGFRELGLPFEADTAITRHLAAFLKAHGSDGQPVRPTHVLFNGGVFKSVPLQERILEVLTAWAPQSPPPQRLEGDHDLDHAVARGAAAYGWSKQRGGVRIRGGTARSYYVGIESAGLAIPGAPRPLRALCAVPFGMEEGTDLDVPSDEIGLIVGEPAQFRFFSSSVRKHDRPGDLLPVISADELEETAPLETTLPADESLEDPYVPVRFHARITELGVFELWCVSTVGDQRWKLEFSVREEN